MFDGYVGPGGIHQEVSDEGLVTVVKKIKKEKTMTSNECVNLVAKQAGIGNAAASKAITAFAALLSEALGGGEKVEFPGGSVGGPGRNNNATEFSELKQDGKKSVTDIVDPREIIISSFTDMPKALVKGKSYHSVLPGDLKDWYCYTIDGGHSILVIAKDHVEQAFSGEVQPYMYSVPAPVKLVLRLGYEIYKGYVITNAKYSNFGLEFEDDDEEF